MHIHKKVLRVKDILRDASGVEPNNKQLVMVNLKQIAQHFYVLFSLLFSYRLIFHFSLVLFLLFLYFSSFSLLHDAIFSKGQPCLLFPSFHSSNIYQWLKDNYLVQSKVTGNFRHLRVYQKDGKYTNHLISY